MTVQDDRRLPPVDALRAPFIEPLGTMTYWAAQIENEILEFCEKTYFTELGRQAEFKNKRGDSAKVLAARELSRNRKEYLLDRLPCVPAHLRAEATEVVDRIDALLRRRHRLIHDVIEIGVDGPDVDGRISFVTVNIGYPRGSKEVDIPHVEVTPGVVCAVARELYEACKDLEDVTLKMMSTAPAHP